MKSLLRSSPSTRTLGLTVAACALAAGAATAARAAPGRASPCPSLDRVKSFQGVAGPSYSDNATASIPGAKEEEAISVEEGATLIVNLPVKRDNGLITIFVGSLPGAQFINVQHALGQPVRGHVAGKDLGSIRSAFVLLSPQLCQYQVNVTYSVSTSYSGDEADNPGGPVTISATTPREAIPASLKLAGSAEIPVYGTCMGASDSVPNPAGCYTFSGGWREDFEKFKLCHSIVPKGDCAVSEGKLGMARISWSLSPTY